MMIKNKIREKIKKIYANFVGKKIYFYDRFICNFVANAHQKRKYTAVTGLPEEVTTESLPYIWRAFATKLQ